MIIVKNFQEFIQLKQLVLENPGNKELYQKLLDFEFDISVEIEEKCEVSA